MDQEDRVSYTIFTKWAHNLVVRIDALESVINKGGLKVTPQEWQDALHVSMNRYPLSSDPSNEVVLEALVAASKTLLDRSPIS